MMADCFWWHPLGGYGIPRRGVVNDKGMGLSGDKGPPCAIGLRGFKPSILGWTCKYWMYPSLCETLSLLGGRGVYM